MAANIEIYNPSELGAPMGQYSHVTRVKANEFLFIAGMLAGDAQDNIVGEGDFDAQATQVFRNIEAALRCQCWVEERRAVHDLSRALARYSEIHGISVARVSQDVPRR